MVLRRHSGPQGTKGKVGQSSEKEAWTKIWSFYNTAYIMGLLEKIITENGENVIIMAERNDIKRHHKV